MGTGSEAHVGPVSDLDDTTELDFGRHRDVEGLGPTGNGSGLGFLLHNGLMVNADTEELVGMAGQAIHYRERKPKGRKRENSSQIKKRRRESEVWGKVVNAIGKPAEGVQFIHVMDRGADNFESIATCCGRTATGSSAPPI
ncbi:MAG: hypothetical protein U0939_18310 [Pirellulales bacterium]